MGEYSDGYISARDIAALLLWSCGKGSLDKDTSSTSTNMEGVDATVVYADVILVQKRVPSLNQTMAQDINLMASSDREPWLDRLSQG